MLSAARKLDQVQIINRILDREGEKYTNDPDDDGGPTKWGVTLVAYRDFLGDPTATAEDVKAITRSTAANVFRSDFIEGFGFERVHDDLLYEILLDCSVNHGPRNAVIILQRAVRTRQDGSLGPVTAGHTNEIVHADLITKVLLVRAKFYADICKRKPAKLKYLNGWLEHRVFGFLPY